MWLGWMGPEVGRLSKIGAWRLGAPSARDLPRRVTLQPSSTNYNWLSKWATVSPASQTSPKKRVGQGGDKGKPVRRQTPGTQLEPVYGFKFVGPRGPQPPHDVFARFYCILQNIQSESPLSRYRLDLGNNCVPFHARTPFVAMTLADGVFLEIPRLFCRRRGLLGSLESGTMYSRIAFSRSPGVHSQGILDQNNANWPPGRKRLCLFSWQSHPAPSERVNQPTADRLNSSIRWSE